MPPPCLHSRHYVHGEGIPLFLAGGSIAGVVIIVGLIVWAKKRSDKGVPIFPCLDEPLSKDKNKGTETTSTSKAGSAA